MVVESATGTKFSQVTQIGIFDVANMTSAFFDGLVSMFSQLGFVLKGESTWNVTLGVFEALVLQHYRNDLIYQVYYYQQVPLPEKDERLGEAGYAHRSLGMSVGAPWEILRSNIVTEDKRLIDIYTKRGEFGLYHALIGAITDYDIVMTVLSGGEQVSLDPDIRTKIFSTIARNLVPAIDKAARDEDKSSNSTLELALDEGSGIAIKKFVVRGFDVMSNFPRYSLGALETCQNTPVNGRIYPVDMSSNAPFQRNHARSIQHRCSTFAMWRAYFDTTTDEQNAAKDEALFYADGSCETWFNFDQTSYGYLSLGEFVFVYDKQGSVTAANSPAFDVTFDKVK
ncbi:hypothetical protein MY11210_002243 [Beauveria gryllotalpidicola]